MILHRRRHGSQRGMAPMRVELVPIVDNRTDTLTFKGSDGIYYTLEAETSAEMRELVQEIRVAQSNRKI